MCLHSKLTTRHIVAASRASPKHLDQYGARDRTNPDGDTRNGEGWHQWFRSHRSPDVSLCVRHARGRSGAALSTTFSATCDATRRTVCTTHPVQVHVNEMLGGAETAAYLIKYDSVHGTWPRKVDNADDHFTVDGRKITFSDKEDFTQASTRTGTRTGTDAGPSSAHAPARCHPAAHIARSKAHPAAACARRSIGRAWVCRS